MTLCILVWGLWHTPCEAGGRRIRTTRPLATGVRVAVPSLADIKNVPVRKEGDLIANPVDILAYGLNLHPGARVVKASVKAATKAATKN